MARQRTEQEYDAAIQRIIKREVALTNKELLNVIEYMAAVKAQNEAVIMRGKARDEYIKALHTLDQKQGKVASQCCIKCGQPLDFEVLETEEGGICDHCAMKGGAQ